MLEIGEGKVLFVPFDYEFNRQTPCVGEYKRLDSKNECYDSHCYYCVICYTALSSSIDWGSIHKRSSIPPLHLLSILLLSSLLPPTRPPSPFPFYLPTTSLFITTTLSHFTGHSLQYSFNLTTFPFSSLNYHSLATQQPTSPSFHNTPHPYPALLSSSLPLLPPLHFSLSSHTDQCCALTTAASAAKLLPSLLLRISLLSDTTINCCCFCICWYWCGYC